jgi:hypothetical protein
MEAERRLCHELNYYSACLITEVGDIKALHVTVLLQYLLSSFPGVCMMKGRYMTILFELQILHCK